MKENIFVESDRSTNCVNYPHGEYESYSGCDQSFLSSALPPGLTPIWVMNNTENVTTRTVIKKMSHPLYSYDDLHDGTQLPPCPLPCATITVESRFLRVSDYDNPAIGLTFSQNMLVTTTHFLQFNFMIFLSDIGGSMGLWLGLGLLQALEISINCVVSRIRK